MTVDCNFDEKFKEIYETKIENNIAKLEQLRLEEKKKHDLWQKTWSLGVFAIFFYYDVFLSTFDKILRRKILYVYS